MSWMRRHLGLPIISSLLTRYVTAAFYTGRHTGLEPPELKVVKQTVMTSVYGVTFVGARKQIQNVLGDKIIQGVEGNAVSVMIMELRPSHQSCLFPVRGLDSLLRCFFPFDRTCMMGIARFLDKTGRRCPESFVLQDVAIVVISDDTCTHTPRALVSCDDVVG